MEGMPHTKDKRSGDNLPVHGAKENCPGQSAVIYAMLTFALLAIVARKEVSYETCVSLTYQSKL